jgi:sigma-E factor negative regulatory protein RseB
VSRGPNAWVAGGTTVALLLLWVLATGETVAAHETQPSDPEAVRLLRDAAYAAQTTPYEGTQFIAAHASDGGARSQVRSQVKVVHALGDGTVVRTGPAAADSGAYQPHAGLGGFTREMLDLLARNYSVVRGADTSVCGRRARVVEARRSDGSIAARFWIDRSTGLMLRRELADGHGRPVVVTGFSALTLLRAHAAGGPLRGRVISIGRIRQSVGTGAVITSPWLHQLGDAELRRLRSGGWAVPRALPGRLSLYEARESDADAVVHVGYSDGLSDVSVFIQRGDLDEHRFAGWRKRSLRGNTVFERNSLQRWAVWANRGYVYTVLADAPASTTESVVAALPHGGAGFWARPARGLTRLGSWINPFD